jgi:hypothetical protein
MVYRVFTEFISGKLTCLGNKNIYLKEADKHIPGSANHKGM